MLTEIEVMRREQNVLRAFTKELRPGILPGFFVGQVGYLLYDGEDAVLDSRQTLFEVTGPLVIASVRGFLVPFVQ